ncbi:MAG: ABC transporter permease [Chloroflexota bacterium]
MFKRILNIAWKEFLHLRKDRVLVPFFILGALLELTVVAWATSQPIRNVPMAVVDQDHSHQSAALIARLDTSDTLSKAQITNSVADVNTLMDHNQAILGVVIPPNYGSMLVAHHPPTVSLLLNGADSTSAYAAQNAAQQIILEQGMRDALHQEPKDYANELPQVTVKYNETLDRSAYTLPSEMGLMFYVMTVVLAALAITRERERGTYEQLLVMPYRSWEVILGKIIAPMTIGYCLFMTMLALSVFIFHVPFRGSLLLLLGLAIIYLIAEVGKGILLSLVARTQLQAVLLVFGVAMVDMLFSGYAVAVESMPPFLQTVSNIFSIRHWLIILRDIMLKGVGLDVFAGHVLAIIAIGTVIIGLTTLVYRRSLT